MPALAKAKHEAFARAIVEGKTGRDAYRAAGYKANDAAAEAAGSRLLRNAKVSARIAEIKAAAAEAAQLSAEKVLGELSKIAFSNMADYMRAGANGDPVLHFSDLTRDQTAALAEITMDSYTDGRGEDAREVKRVKFKLWDKRAALVDLGRHLGLFKDRVEHTGPGGGPVQITDGDAARERIAERLKTIARRTTDDPADGSA